MPPEHAASEALPSFLFHAKFTIRRRAFTSPPSGGISTKFPLVYDVGILYIDFKFSGALTSRTRTYAGMQGKSTHAVAISCYRRLY